MQPLDDVKRHVLEWNHLKSEIKIFQRLVHESQSQVDFVDTLEERRRVQHLLESFGGAKKR